jgi:glyoxylase-like metal-dependent hydrolase (beta-lactamase superfamily II)
MTNPQLPVVRRLYLGSIDSHFGPAVPFHGYVIDHGDGVILVDSGMKPGYETPTEVKMVLRPIVDALADHGLHPSDVSHVVSTHLHWDHYGQNAAFKGVPFVVQNAELERARREEPRIAEYFDFVGAKFELIEGDAELVPGVRLMSTPGHTIGHQSVLVQGPVTELIVGDAAYSIDIWERPDDLVSGAGQLWQDTGWPVDWVRSRQVTSGDFEMWRASLERLRQLEGVDLYHICHDHRVGGSLAPRPRDRPGQGAQRSVAPASTLSSVPVT